MEFRCFSQASSSPAPCGVMNYCTNILKPQVEVIGPSSCAFFGGREPELVRSPSRKVATLPAKVGTASAGAAAGAEPDRFASSFYGRLQQRSCLAVTKADSGTLDIPVPECYTAAGAAAAARSKSEASPAASDASTASGDSTSADSRSDDSHGSDAHGAQVADGSTPHGAITRALDKRNLLVGYQYWEREVKPPGPALCGDGLKRLLLGAVTCCSS